MAFETRKYVIIPATEVINIDFTQVLETSAETCRYSVDGSKTFVKYEGEEPSSVAVIADRSQEYSHDEILAVLATEEWTPQTED
jgi:hypothetical protein